VLLVWRCIARRGIATSAKSILWPDLSSGNCHHEDFREGSPREQAGRLFRPEWAALKQTFREATKNHARRIRLLP
jgi:hypothetical protein